jgi:hypothetical protein
MRKRSAVAIVSNSSKAVPRKPCTSAIALTESQLWLLFGLKMT